MKYDAKIIGNRIRQLRGNLSRREFEETTGISVNTSKDLESGRKLPRVETIIDICEKTNSEVGYIFGDYGKPSLDETYIVEKTGLKEETISKIIEAANTIRETRDGNLTMQSEAELAQALLSLIDDIMAIKNRDFIFLVSDYLSIKTDTNPYARHTDFNIIRQLYEDCSNISSLKELQNFAGNDTGSSSDECAYEEYTRSLEEFEKFTKEFGKEMGLESCGKVESSETSHNDNAKYFFELLKYCREVDRSMNTEKDQMAYDLNFVRIINSIKNQVKEE